MSGAPITISTRLRRCPIPKNQGWGDDGSADIFGIDNADDCLAAAENCERSEVSLHVVDLGGNAIDTATAPGRFMLFILAGAAEMERNLIRERTRSAMAVKRANGQRIGTIPHGFDLADDGRGLVANDAERAVIAEMQTMRARGWTLEAIVEELNEPSVPTKTEPRWAHQVVDKILPRISQMECG